MTISNTVVSAGVKGSVTSSPDIGSLNYAINFASSLTFENGTGANQANMIFADTRTLSASATEDLDLAGGLTSALGVTLTFTKIKAIIITAAAGNTNAVNITRPAANGVPIFIAAGDGISLTPGGIFAAALPNAAGVTVTAGTGDLLTLTNSAGTTPVTYNIVIVGIV